MQQDVFHRSCSCPSRQWMVAIAREYPRCPQETLSMASHWRRLGSRLIGVVLAECGVPDSARSAPTKVRLEHETNPPRADGRGVHTKRQVSSDQIKHNQVSRRQRRKKILPFCPVPYGTRGQPGIRGGLDSEHLCMSSAVALATTCIMLAWSVDSPELLHLASTTICSGINELPLDSTGTPQRSVANLVDASFVQAVLLPELVMQSGAREDPTTM